VGVRYRIPAATGVAFLVDRGQVLRVISPTGRQVSDLFSVLRDDPREALSSGRSIDYADKLWLTTGDVLYGTFSTPLWTLLRDDVGRHDLTLTPCSPEMFVKLFDAHGHPSCFENLRRPLARFDVPPERITCSFNIFMDVRFAPDTGKMAISPPPAQPGDLLELRAEADLVVALTACSSENTNGGALHPIDFEIAQ
jgi:uncharacterized protein YcgI (DUF1989 family)